MNMEHLTMAFELMGVGMAGVFIVLGILYAVAEILIKVLPAED
ncbi:OadG-related small transporter subunit [Streptococcus hongkongensis]|nr:membrane protein [Streptococcus uberis]